MSQLDIKEMEKYRTTDTRKLFAAVDAALFELHRNLETEHKDASWREIYGLRLRVAEVESGIMFRKYQLPAPPVTPKE